MNLSRFAIREGWTTVLLVSMVVYISVWSILQADWADGLGILNLITLVGLAAGVVVSKWRRAPRALAHVGAVLVGGVVVVYQMTNYLDDRLGSRADKLRWLWDRGDRWLSTIVNGEQAEDLYLFVLFICALTFLLAYGTMWFVLRARWIWAALVFPGMLLFINLGYSLRVPTSYVFFYLFFSMLLLVRFFILERETDWRRLRIDYPQTLVWRGLWAASYLAIFIMIFGWAFPASARSERAHDAWLRVDGPWRTVEQQLNEWFAGLNGNNRRSIGGFASFSDEFTLGGPLRLSDAPVVLVTGTETSPYLAAHRYAYYTGHGWESDVTGETQTEATQQIPPQVELETGESVPISKQIEQNRDPAEYTIQVRRGRGSLMFAPEVFASADVPANLVLYWKMAQNEVLDLQSATPQMVPDDDLWALVELLRQADFTPPPPPTPTPDPSATPTPGATPSPTVAATPTPPPAPVEPADVKEAILALAERDIFVSYDVDLSSYKATTLTYSGQFPIYDEVEAVYAREGLSSGSQYTVTSLEVPVGSSDALREAGRLAGQDPADVTGRYVQLPDTVTERTIRLAQEITDRADNRYDKSKLLEQYLRATIEYREDIKVPPDDQDVVDYVLFDSRQGYCEYYASAFVVMARAVGIPARIAVGFFPADFDDAEDGYLYRERNAHAWPEVYFPGYGWVRFEPTASRPETNYDPVPAVEDTAPDSGAAIIGGEGDLLPEDPFLDPRQLRESGGGTVIPGSSGDDSVSRLEWGLRLLFLLLMSATLAIGYFWLRGLRGLSPTEQLYTKLSRGANWGGIKSQSSMTPHEYAQVLAHDIPGSRGPATYLTDLYVQETYGNRKPSQMELVRARQAWQRLRGLFLKYFFTRLRPWRPSAPQDQDDDW